MNQIEVSMRNNFFLMALLTSLFLSACWPQDNPGAQEPNITSGRVNTMHKVSFTHGRLDALIKVPKIANGMWPAFWLMGENFEAEGWPECGEIDIMELGSADGINQGTQERFLTGGAHWGSMSSADAHPVYSQSSDVGSDLSEGFHLYTMIWNESHIKMYLDLDKNPSAAPYYEIRIDAGALNQGKYHVKDYFHQPFFIVLNLAVGGDFPKIYDSDTITALNGENNYEAKMYVDYIQVTSDDCTWKDNFDGTALNSEYWNIEINSDGGGNHELQTYSAGNVSIEVEPESNKKCLVLTAKKQWP
jgi:beta-glucanase (GH16 family)